MPSYSLPCVFICLPRNVENEEITEVTAKVFLFITLAILFFVAPRSLMQSTRNISYTHTHKHKHKKASNNSSKRIRNSPKWRNKIKIWNLLKVKGKTFEKLFQDVGFFGAGIDVCFDVTILQNNFLLHNDTSI